MTDFVIAVLILIGLLAAYRVGYHHGVAFCMRQLKPLEDAARELARMHRR